MAFAVPSSVYRFALGLMWGCMAFSALAQTQEDLIDQDADWSEMLLTMPQGPKETALLPIQVGPTASQRFFIDSQSVSVSKDGVVRYTLISVGNGGAKNISYEGLRCESREKRLYAFGRQDGSWSKARSSSWGKINPKALNTQHATLANDYFCMASTVAGTAAQIVKRLRDNELLNAVKD